VKILHVLDHSIPLHSGYTFRTRAILEQQRALGWETVQVTSSKQGRSAVEMEEVDGFRFYRTPPSSGLLSKLPVANQWAVVESLARRLDDVIRRESPDLLHAHSPALNGMAALRMGRRHGLPVIYECRAFWEDAAVDHGTSREGGVRYRLTRAMETHVFREADAVTTICEGLKSDIVARGIDEEKVTVIPNAVDLERFSTESARDAELAARLGLEGKVVLGFLGSFYAYEGLMLLVEAMPQILEHRPEVRLLLVGGGPQEAELRERVRQSGLEDQVVFTGRVPHDEVDRYYGLVDILVYPRLAMRLTQLVTPLKPLEAMAQGKLVVASDVGGHLELVKNDVTGRLFHAGDPRALAETVIDMVGHPHRWERMRQSARRFVERERSWPRSVGRYRLVYAKALSKKQRAPFSAERG